MSTSTLRVMPSSPWPADPPVRRRPRSAQGRAREAHRRLGEEYPDAECALVHSNPFELLVATILSAQCTDVRVNMVTPELFARFPTAQDLVAADPAELEELIRSTGFFRSKTRSLLGMAADLAERHDGEVPSRMAELTALAGVGRKTANVVRSVALGEPGLPVDTHVGRLARRLALTTEDDPVKVELELNPMIPAAERGLFSLRLILHGRQVCVARTPRCGECVLADFCPSATLAV
ncbi:endonuclease III [soil metagenome]